MINKSILLIILALFCMSNAEPEMPDTNNIWPELVWQVSKGVLIVEGLNYLYRNHKKIWAPAKSLERYRAVKAMVSVALATWDSYQTWKKLMDNIAGFVDDMEYSRQMVENAEQTLVSIMDYYREFDWDELKLTNLTMLIPEFRFVMLDYYINGALYYAGDAFDHLAFASLLTEDVILNPCRRSRIAACDQAISNTYANIARQNKALNDPEEGISNQLNELDENTVTGGNDIHSGQNYHASSILASLAYDLHHTKVKTVSSSMVNTLMVLDLISSEARDWERERIFIQGHLYDGWAKSNMFSYNSAPVVFHKDLDIDWVNYESGILKK